MAEKEEWSNTWEWEGKIFIKCERCKKSMLEENKGEHQCPEGPETPPPKESKGTLEKNSKPPATIDDIMNTGVDIMSRCFKEVGEITGRKPPAGDDVRMVDSLFIFATMEISGRHGKRS